MADKLARDSEVQKANVSILDLSEEDYAPEKMDVLGIVAPTYAWGLPDLVLAFLDKLRVKAKPEYSFFLATYGTTPGNAARLAAKAQHFDAFYSIKMPDTWTVMFDLSDKDKVAEINKKADEELQERIGQIRERKTGNFTRNRIPGFTEIFYMPYYDNLYHSGGIRRNWCFHVGQAEKWNRLAEFGLLPEIIKIRLMEIDMSLSAVFFSLSFVCIPFPRLP